MRLTALSCELSCLVRGLSLSPLSGKKKAGNARVANRQKYDKLVKRRKGAVQEMREGAADGATYDGEATGLRTNLRKSMKLG